MVTLKDLAEKVLFETKKPMSAEEIWNYAVEKGYNKLQAWKGKTPWITIAAKIKADIRDNDQSKFEKINERPAKFVYKGLDIVEYSNNIEKNNFYYHKYKTLVAHR